MLEFGNTVLTNLTTHAPTCRPLDLGHTGFSQGKGQREAHVADPLPWLCVHTQVRNLENEITKKTPPPCASTDAVFYAGTGMLLCRSEDKVGARFKVYGEPAGRWG